MIQNNISKYLANKIILSVLLSFAYSFVIGQNQIKETSKEQQEKTITPVDTIPYKYGLRFGIDIAGPISMMVNGNKILYKGSFDARVHKRYFVASEFGYEEFNYNTENLKYKTDGGFIMLGGDYDLLGYTPGRNDVIAFGLRYGFSKLNQTVTEYKIQNGYWLDDTYIGSEDLQEGYANWINVRLGIKVEVLTNFYLGLSTGVNFLINDTTLENFDNLYIPGFGENKNKKSWVFNYTLMYLLPFN